jgi:hypothetical protein
VPAFFIPGLCLAVMPQADYVVNYLKNGINNKRETTVNYNIPHNTELAKRMTSIATMLL